VISQVIVDIVKRPWETGIEYYYWIGGFIAIGVAFLVWNLDQNGLCYPNSIFQGHGLWHILNGLVCYFLYMFYRSEVLKPKKTENINESNDNNLLVVHSE
jgi:hypothetical protein